MSYWTYFTFLYKIDIPDISVNPGTADTHPIPASDAPERVGAPVALSLDADPVSLLPFLHHDETTQRR